MNNKIKLLAEQAGALIEIGEKSHYIMVEPGNGAALEKFAELLINECAAFISLGGYEDGNRLKRHFGVE